MALAITGIYAGLMGLWMLFLGFAVMRQRRRHDVSVMSGGVRELELAIRAHGNACEYIPIALILMGITEAGGASGWLLNVMGILLVAGRLLHGTYFLTGAKDLNVRIAGMVLTIAVIGLLAIRAIVDGIGGFGA